jgi:DNA polymerase-3 subunit alpha
MAALLSLEDTPDKVPYFLEECKRMKISIIPPNINISDCEFSVSGKEIHFGLRAIKNVGDSAIKAIVADREKNGKYKTIFEFSNRLDSMSVNKSVLESLIACGAMDELEGTRAQKWSMVETALDHASGHQRERKRGQTSLFDLLEDEVDNSFTPVLPEVENWSYLYQLEMEKDILGFYLSGHPLKPYKEIIDLFTSSRGNGKDKNTGNDISLIGVVIGISKKRDSKNNAMAFIELEDLHGRFEVSLFNKDYDKFLTQFEIGKVYFINGTRSQYNSGEDAAIRVIPKKVMTFESMPYHLKGEAIIETDEKKITAEFLEQINKLKVQARGHFSLKFLIHTAEFKALYLQPQAFNFFPDLEFIQWCKEQNLNLKVSLGSNE